LDPSIFSSPWAYVDHLVLTPGAASGTHLHREVAEFYYVMSGQGVATVGSETAPVGAGDAIPIQLGEIHAFENPGSTPLEFLIVGVSRDSNRRVDSVDTQNLGGRRN
jgi:mannose-6-phosphate isomerase-like protein (cupin superfamily)